MNGTETPDATVPPLPSTRMRRFYLYRRGDPSGISGTGYVCEGVEWSDGIVHLKWLTAHVSESRYATIKEVLNVHGHSGQTVVVWVDPELHPPATPETT